MNTHITRTAIIKARSGRNSSPLEVRVDFSPLVVVVVVSGVVVVVTVGSLAASWSSVNGLGGVFLVPVAVFLVIVSGAVASENV